MPQVHDSHCILIPYLNVEHRVISKQCLPALHQDGKPEEASKAETVEKGNTMQEVR